MISGPFKTGQEATEAGIACHEQQTKDFMKTVHWTWQEQQKVPAKGEMSIGKINLLNSRYDFVETVMYWKVNHMVAPKQAAFRRTSCHRDTGGLLNWKALGYAGDPAQAAAR